MSVYSGTGNAAPPPARSAADNLYISRIWIIIIVKKVLPSDSDTPHQPFVDFDYITDIVIGMAINEDNIGNSEEDLTVRNIITHMDFDLIQGPDKITYATKKDDRGRKVMLLYQFSYVPLDASPGNAQNVRRPFAMKVTKNNNLVYSIQSVKEMNQSFSPYVKIHNDSYVEIEFDGYDNATTAIYLFGLVAEPIGTIMNG